MESEWHHPIFLTISSYVPPHCLPTAPPLSAQFMYWKEFPASTPLGDDGEPREFTPEFYEKLEKKFPIRNMPLLIKAGAVTMMVVILLFLHPVHHKGSHWIAFLGAVAILLLAKPHEFHHLLDMVEWDTLLFFAGLFVLIEGLAELGLLRTIAGMIADTIATVDDSSRLAVAILMMIWLNACASAILDNIPFTATMVPIIIQLSENPDLGLDIRPLAWSLALGACIGGIGTLVGASCTLVTAGIAEAQGYKMGFFSYTMRRAFRGALPHYRDRLHAYRLRRLGPKPVSMRERSRHAHTATASGTGSTTGGNNKFTSQQQKQLPLHRRRIAVAHDLV